MKAALLLAVLALTGCSGGNAPSRAYITSLRCEGLVRTHGKLIQDTERDRRAGKYPADLNKVQFSLKCPDL